MNNFLLSVEAISETYSECQSRDPMPDFLGYERRIKFSCDYLLDGVDTVEKQLDIEDLPLAKNKTGFSNSCLGEIAKLACLAYGRGVSHTILQGYVSSAIFLAEPIMPLYVKYRAEELGWPEARIGTRPFRLRRLGDEFRFIALVLLLEMDAGILQRWMRFVKNDSDSTYVADVLLKAFVPDWSVQKKYSKFEIYDRPRLVIALQKALSAPDKAGKEAGLAQYMAQWNRMLKPYGWKPERKYTWTDRSKRKPADHDQGFYEFAYEVALAVCAWDLDDSAFRDHPYYPRDLVEHYRAHVRHTRDAWRAEGVGSGLAVQAPPPPKRIDLAKSRAKGYKRWLELLCDGDQDAVKAIVEEGGSLRSLKSRWDEALCALAEAGHAVRADLKDDDSLQGQIDELSANRQIADFEPPDEPPAGPIRCEMLMSAAPAWAQAQGYTWQPLDDEGDNWLAVLLRQEFVAEWLALSEQLKLPMALLR